MKVILTADVDPLGKSGELKDVANGYARNYLIPRGYAMRWTRGAERQIDTLRSAKNEREIAGAGTA